MVYIGIDPGMTGAVVAIRDTLEVWAVADTPTFRAGKGREYDIPEMAAILRGMILASEAQVVLERAQPMPKQGVSSTFNFGRGYGIWEGILGALGVRYRTVRPGEWTKKVLNGLPGKGKARSIQFARQMFPDLELIPEGCRVPRDGRADAACLSYYGAKMWHA